MRSGSRRLLAAFAAISVLAPLAGADTKPKKAPDPRRVYERARLGSGDRMAGPAIVEQPDTTVLIPEGDVADVDRFGNLLIKREA